MSGGGPTIRQLVDAAREEYRVTNDGLVTAAEELANLEMEREREQDRLDRLGFVKCAECGAEVRLDREACVMCGGELR